MAAQDVEMDDIRRFGQGDRLPVRLNDVICNLPRLARLIQPLILGGKRVTWVPKVLQHTSRKFRCVEVKVPPMRRGKRDGKKASSEAARASGQARESEVSWLERAGFLARRIDATGGRSFEAST